MAKKKKETVQDEQKAPKLFENADLVLTCKCGNKDILHTNVQGGIRVDLYTTDNHKLVLGCSKCGSKLEMAFEEQPVTEEQIAAKELKEAEDKAKEEMNETLPVDDITDVEFENETEEIKDEEPVCEENTEKESV